MGTDVGKTRDVLLGSAGVFVVCAAMLTFPLLVEPSRAYYQLMKWVVAGGSIYGAYTFWSISPKYVPVCFLQLAVGGIHFFGNMQADEWDDFHWAGIAVFAISTALIGVRLRSSKRVRESNQPSDRVR